MAHSQDLTALLGRRSKTSLIITGEREALMGANNGQVDRCKVYDTDKQ
jgi:hypothetical protein